MYRCSFMRETLTFMINIVCTHVYIRTQVIECYHNYYVITLMVVIIAFKWCCKEGVSV